MSIIYTGVFFGENNFKYHLNNKIKNPHVTHQYKPNYIDYSLFGQEVIFKIVGYGNDLENEGYLVEIKKASKEMKKALKNIEVPHITISVSKQGKAVNTRFLNFKPCESFEIKGIYGGFDGKKII